MVAYNNAADGLTDDSTNGEAFDCETGAVIDCHHCFSALSLGTLLGIEDVTQETRRAHATSTIMDSKLDLLAA